MWREQRKEKEESAERSETARRGGREDRRGERREARITRGQLPDTALYVEAFVLDLTRCLCASRAPGKRNKCVGGGLPYSRSVARPRPEHVELGPQEPGQFRGPPPYPPLNSLNLLTYAATYHGVYVLRHVVTCVSIALEHTRTLRKTQGTAPSSHGR